MTFFIPPVFLFGNNANIYNNKKKKSEYKTAAETEIKVENWRVKRIAELEEENKKLKDSNTILKKGGQVVFTLEKRIDELLEENKKLKEDNRFLTKISKEYMEKENIIEVTEFTELYKNDLEEENKKLKKELEYYKNKSSRQEAVIKIAAME